MSTKASRWIDSRISDALADAFEQIDAYIREGHCTKEDAFRTIANGWDDAVLEGWREWIAEADDG